MAMATDEEIIAQAKLVAELLRGKVRRRHSLSYLDPAGADAAKAVVRLAEMFDEREAP